MATSPAVFAGLTMLTGCPGIGDRLQPEETAKVFSSGKDICFSIINAGDYQLEDIGINPRGTASRDKTFIVEPKLDIFDGKLCLPPAFYPFSDD